MVKDKIYGITISEKQINTKKIAILILLIIVAIGLILVARNAIEMIKQHKVYKQYEAQLATLAKQEEVEPMEEPKEKVENMPKLTEEARNNIQTIYQSETKRAFLTFDDGPSTVTPTILDVLKQENVKASFFVLGSRVNAMPEMTKRIYDEGHYVANHGYSHSYSAIYASPQAVLDEFNECNKAVRNAIGVSDYHSHLFRFPGGLPGGKYAEIKRQAKELLSQNDIVNIDWNALTGDAETANPTVEFEMQRIQETVNNKSSVVILMHDAQAKAVTAEALPQIISWLRENGYEFKNFYEIMK
jgi:peptidoglycan/xylan/chitin deacetylase (PgdA/CDA1 family)